MGQVSDYSPILRGVYRQGAIGRAITSDALWNIINRVSSDTDIGNFNLEDLRASGVVLMYNAGADIKVINRVLGHSTLGATAHYIQDLPTNLTTKFDWDEIFLL